MPVNPTYPGVYIEESPDPIKPISGVCTSITAFIGLARKGPVNDPTIIYNFEEYQRKFGGLWGPSHMSYSVSQFYNNGGREAVIVRVTDITSIAEFNSPSNILEFVASSPGSWSKNLKIKTDKESLPYGNDNFNIRIVEKIGESEKNLESYLNLSANEDEERYATKIVNESSKYVQIKEDIEYTAIPAGLEFSCSDTPIDDELLTESMILGDESDNTGIYALEKTDIFNLLCIPSFDLDKDTMKRIYEKAIPYCEKRRAILIVDPPYEWKDQTGPINEPIEIYPHENASLFFPRFWVRDPENDERPRKYSPSGAIAGVIARIDSQRGIWKAPAGLDAVILGSIKLDLELTDEETSVLNSNGINCLRTFPNRKPMIWGARTMVGSDTQSNQWKYLPVRRMALYIEESIDRGLKWVVFEPNDESLWSSIRLYVRSFMHNLFRQGAFQGSKQNDAYFIKCDNETTVQTDIDRGIVNIFVGFAPLKPAEFIILRIQQIAGQENT